MESVDWDERYKGNPDMRPWDTGLPDPFLVECLQSLESLPKRALEIGCGTGTNALWMAQNGIDVVATDISDTAIRAAQGREQKQATKASFVVEDICERLPVKRGSVEFVFDRGVFHVMPADKRPVFVQHVAESLADRGFWFCLAGSADETKPADKGPPRLRASALIESVEEWFEVYELERAYFELPDQSRYLAWALLLRKRI